MADAREIERLEEARLAATRAGNADALAPLLDDELLYVHSTGNGDTKASYLAGLRSGQVVYETLEASERRIIAKEATAAVFFVMKARVRIGPEIRHLDTRVLAVWGKSGGDWRLVALSSASRS